MSLPEASSVETLLRALQHGEDSSRQFKRDVTNVEALAAEMAAFANAEGGTIYLGVDDDGTTPGLSAEDVRRINQLIANAAAQGVRSPLVVQSHNVVLEGGRIVIVLTVPKGLDKPYFDKNGVIWLKVGSDKRRVNTKEELRRLFQWSGQFHADELPTRAGPDAIDELRFRDFLRDTYGETLPSDADERLRLLRNLNLATSEGTLNLAGLLLFGEMPQRVKPAFVIKAVRYPGVHIHATSYVDTQDIEGPFRRMFDDALAFIMRNLRRVQAGPSVNSPGVPEIPPLVFEELLVNAMVHRDYLISAPIRIFVFDDRIEIISPGTLPNNLTVEIIKQGNSNLRNPILASYVAKGLLPYRGLGSGVPRALEHWPSIDLRDDREANLFVATVRRRQPSAELISDPSTPLTASETTQSTTQRTTPVGLNTPRRAQGTTQSADRILALLSANPRLTREQLAEELGITPNGVKYHLRRLQKHGRLRRVGGDFGGYWEVIQRASP